MTEQSSYQETANLKQVHVQGICQRLYKIGCSRTIIERVVLSKSYPRGERKFKYD